MLSIDNDWGGRQRDEPAPFDGRFNAARIDAGERRFATVNLVAAKGVIAVVA